MRSVTSENWQEASKGKTVLDFYATWCGPCKKQFEILTEMEKTENKVGFWKVDIEECYDIAEKFHVKSVPTIVVLEEGKEVARLEGFQNNQKLQQFLVAS